MSLKGLFIDFRGDERKTEKYYFTILNISWSFFPQFLLSEKEKIGIGERWCFLLFFLCRIFYFFYVSQSTCCPFPFRSKWFNFIVGYFLLGHISFNRFFVTYRYLKIGIVIFKESRFMAFIGKFLKTKVLNIPLSTLNFLLWKKKCLQNMMLISGKI